MTIFARKPENPFFITTAIPDQYFCDRKKETEKLISMIENGQNIVLTSERRLGKSSLLRHLLRQPAIRNNYNTLYVDVSDTHTPEDFVNAIKQSMASSDVGAFSQSVKKEMEEITKEFSGNIGLGISPVSMEANMRVQKMIRDKMTIDKIFDLFDRTKKPNVIVFDEFQQIETYAEKITARLRSHIQAMPGSSFIFSGSSVHMLSSMFSSYNQPFYNSSSYFGLNPIPEEAYTEFCREMFSLYGKDVKPETVSLAYDLFWGSTLNLQGMMNRVFAITEKNTAAGTEHLKEALHSILDERNDTYQAAFNALKTDRNKKVFACIASEGVAKEMTSAAMIAKYGLGASSSVQNALAFLAEPEGGVVTKGLSGAYTINDRFFELWTARRLGLLEAKLSGAPEIHRLYRESKQPKIPKSLQRL